MQQSSVADLLVDHVVQEGIDVVFTVPGGTAVPLLQALSKHPNVRVVVAKDEAGAAYAADGYAWETGKPGVVVTIGGPGATNTLTGLSCSAAQGHPIVLVSGEVNSASLGRRAAQDGSDLAFDVLAMSRPVTALSVDVSSAAKAPVAFAEALRRAVHYRRPVHLSIPLDVQLAPAPAPHHAVKAGRRASVSRAFDGAALTRAVRLLREESRAALLIGTGARDCSEEVLELAERLQCPVATTCGAKGVFPEHHPLSLGVFSFGSGPLARAVLGEPLPVLCAVGTGLGEFASLNYSAALQPTRGLIHIDDDPAVFGRNYASLAVAGDARAALRELNRQLADVVRPFPGWLTTLAQEHPLLNDAAHFVSDREPLRPERVMAEIARSLPRDARVVADIGTSCLFVGQYLKISPPQRCYIPMAWSCMAHPLGASLGVRMGSKRPTLCVTGDAAFLAKGLELHAAVENGISGLVWLVLSNRGHGLVRMGTQLLLGEQHGVEAGDFKARVNAAGVAEAVGARAAVVQRVDELGPLLERAFGDDCPWVIDVHVEPDAVPPMADRIQGLQGGPAEGRQ